MSVEKVLARGRQVRLKLMRARCVIERPSGERTFDPSIGDYVVKPPQKLYDGPCHFKAWSSMGQRIGNASEREVVLTQYDVIIPWANDSLVVGTSDVVRITQTDDTWVIGIPLAVTSVEFSHDRTARHMTVTDQDNGEAQYG